LQEHLRDAKAFFKEAGDLLDCQDPTLASGQIQQGVRLTAKILAKLERYYSGYEQLRTLVVPTELPKGIQDTLSGYFDTIKGELAKYKATEATFDARMINMDNIFELKNDLWRYLSTQMDQFFRPSHADTEVMEDLAKVLGEFKAAVGNIRTDPNELPDPRGYWQDDLCPRLSELWSEVQSTRVTITADQDPGAKNTMALMSRRSILAPDKLRQVESPPAGVEGFEIGAIARVSRRNWLMYIIVRGLLLSLLMSLGIYKYYEATFLGTYSDWTAILLFAFSLDVTAEGVASLRDKQGKGG
jgi:hypothetical protein